jgi:recombination protein RecA
MSSKKASLDANVRDIMSAVEKSHGKNSIICLGDQPESEVVEVIPSGSRALDAAIGIGGYPRGRVVEIFGPESSGKTTLTLHAVAQVQARGGVAAFIDAEHALDVRYARGVGVDPKRLLVSQPDFGEQALDIVEMLARSGAVDLVVVDSVAALVPKAEIEGHVGDHHVGLHARLMSQALRKLAGAAQRSGTTVIFINQLRQKIGVIFGSPETTTGGQALKFYASLRLDVRRIGKVLVGETNIGNRTRVKVVKNKCAPPFAEIEFDIRWGAGIDAVGDLIDLAEEQGVVTKNGSHYALDGKAFAHGREKAREAILGDKDLRKVLESRVSSASQPSGPAHRAA